MKILPKDFFKNCTRTVGNENEIDKIMSRVLVLQRIVGNQILDPQWSWKKSFPHQLVTGILVLYVIFGTLDVVKNTDDAKTIAEAAYTGLIISIIPVRFYMFINTRHDFRRLYVMLKVSLYASIRNDSEKKLKNFTKKMKILVNTFLVSMLSPVIMYIITAMCYYVNGERRTLSKTTSILMPMTSPYYEIGLVLHSVFMFNAAFIIEVTDLWFMILMFFFVAACDVTTKKLAVEEKQNEGPTEYATRLNDALRAFYMSHVKVTEYLCTLNAMYKWIALMPLVCVALCSCIILLLLSKGIDLTFVSNLIPNVVILFVYNWFGELVKNKAQNWRTALLEFDWQSLSPKHKKCYFLTVCYMEKDIGLITATGLHLSLLTMSGSIKFSYQMFTVLQNMDS